MAKRKLNLEKNTKSVFRKITTIHGANQFEGKTGWNYLSWSMMMVLNVIATVAFIIIIKNRYTVMQVVTGINANCKVSQVPFPAVSICNLNMVSLKETQKIQTVLENFNRSQTEIELFFRRLEDLKFNHFDEDAIYDFKKIMDILKQHYFSMDTIMEEVAQKCEDLLIYCQFNGKVKNCDSIFSLVKTLEGHCCIFNYAALNDGSEDPMMPKDEDMEYYIDEDESESISKTLDKIIATGASGRYSGLNVVFNVQPNNYPTWSSVDSYGVKVLLSDPNDFPETTVISRFVTVGQAIDIKLEPMVFLSHADVRQVDPEKRNCWFHDEVFLEHTNRYSFETCWTECRMRRYQDRCGCIPYKYPREKTSRICGFEDLPCLHNITVYAKNLKPCQPICYMECRDQKYRAISDIRPFQKEFYQKNISKNKNVDEFSAVQVYYTKPSCNCYKLSLLIDMNNFIATYGGVISLTFGVSIISVYEIIYLSVQSVTKSFWRFIRKKCETP